MKHIHPLISISLATSTLALVAAGPSFAATLVPFSFSTQFSTSSEPLDPEKDILLESVTYDDITTSDFDLVKSADIVFNEPYTGGNTGAASAEHGDQTIGDSLVGQGPAVEDPSNADVVAALGNLNLNSIIDTEDDGTATIDVSFAAPTSRFFFWERGLNSDLLVEALDDAQNVIASYKIDRDLWEPAGYRIKTTEIPTTQRVGALGLYLEESSVKTLRLTSSGARYNGPDYKVVAAAEETTDIPEPGLVLALTALGGTLLGLNRRGRQSQA